MKKLTQLLFSVVCIGTLVLGACGGKTTSESTSESASEPTSESVSESESPSESESETHVHSWKTTWSSDGTNHWHDCEGCDEKKDVAAHVFNDAHDNVCDICGYEREIAEDHTPSVDWSSDEEFHWHSCMHEGCDIVYDRNPHQIQSVWSYDETGHWHECSTCGYLKGFEVHIYDDEFDATCNTCGFERTPAHAHNWASEWSSDENNHWHACSGCDEKNDLGTHVFDDDHDTTCNTCGYVRDIGDHTPKSAWSHDKLHHWHACNHPNCESKFDYGEHNCRKTGTCVVCEINIADDFTLDTSTESVVINYGHLDAGTYFFRVAEFRNEYDYYLRFPYDALVKCHYYATEDATEFSTKSYNCSWAAGTTVQLPRSVSFHTTFVFEFTIGDVPGRNYDGIQIWVPGFGS